MEQPNNPNPSGAPSPGGAPTPYHEMKYSELLAPEIRSAPENAEFIRRFGEKPAHEVATAYRNLEKKLGERPPGIIIPGENAKPEEIAAYHKAIGVPDDPKGYTIPTVENTPIDQARIDAFLPQAHQLGLTQTQVAGLIQAEIERGRQTQENNQKWVTEQFGRHYKTDAEKTAAIEAGKKTLTRIAEKNPEFAKELEAFLGNDPHFTRTMELLSEMFREGQGLRPEEIERQKMDLSKREEEIVKKLDDDATPPAERKNLRRELDMILRQKEK